MARTRVVASVAGRLEAMLPRWPAGAPLPAEQALADELGVAKGTLRRAMAGLAARGLVHTHNGVGTVVADNAPPFARDLVFLCRDPVFFVETAAAFCRAASEANYLAALWPLPEDAAGRTRLFDTARARRPSGVLVYGGSDEDGARLAASGVPVVFLVRKPEGVAADLVTFGNAGGMAALVKRLYRDGCRDFALYGDDAVNPSAARERTEGFLVGLRQCRLRPRDGFLCPPDAPRAARERFFAAFAARRRPDAVCCLNDACAGNFLREAAKRGLSLRGARIAGFDHAPLAPFLPCDFTTAAPPMRAMGEEAARLLVRRVETPGLAPVRKTFAARIVRVPRAPVPDADAPTRAAGKKTHA